MSGSISIVGHQTALSLPGYVAGQLNALFPDDRLDGDTAALTDVMPNALNRMRPLLAAIRNFTPETFNPYNSLQYASFLYVLANERWRTGAGDTLAERLFCLNRALNAIDLFYSVELPEVFFISHGLGAVLGRAKYGERFVFFQNVTVGRVGDHAPTLGNDVVLYPGAQITGNATIGDRCVLSAGVHVHEISIPDDSVVFNGPQGLVIKQRRKDYVGLYLRAPNE